ncbi:MAG TPA: M20/M25/M40 family metallo-hydrolase, partial [Pirellulaceae bacterium]|nr:M20/M25/M40 family metallo-hydrolase [Pirellulaceae bacterium]
MNELDVLNGCDSLMLQQVEVLANINSGTYHLEGIQRVQNLLADWYAPLGGDVQWVPSDGQSSVDDRGQVVQQPLGPTLVISKRLDRRPRLLLCIHCDTVYGVDHPFQCCRRLDTNTLNGPGVIDAKGGLVIMLHALTALERSPWADRIGWQVAINADEEIGSPGSVATLHRLAREADWGLLFEPRLPDGSMVSWRKGSGNFTLVVRGQAAHAGRDFGKGRNACVALSRLLVAVHELNNPADPEFGEVTFNVGRMVGGG